ncbi:hypothetical protein N431DRAFT_327860 [Stipitochalara longipes BDJ]|nr:hypothetical protein N431DRAFT_327860 [Stipitochalara longipes BDJ]
MTDWPFDRNASLRSSCGSIWSTYFYKWIATANRNVDPPFQTNVHAKISKGITLDYVYDTWTSTFIEPDTTIETLNLPASPGTTGHEDFTASSPCCRTCTFSMGDIEVYHWPTGTVASSLQTLTNTDGYYFVYPSIYVSFHTIAARDLCGLVGTAPGLTGATTIGFDPSELSTANSYWYNQTVQTTTPRWYPVYDYKSAAWDNDMTCTNITTSLYIAYDSENTVIESPAQTMSTTTLTYSIVPQGQPWSYYTLTITWHPVNLPVTYNPCQPWLSVPQKVYNMQPAWTSCLQNIKGIRDPPSLLTTGTAFGPYVSKPGWLLLHSATTNAASAAPALAQITPTRTPSPTLQLTSPPEYNPPSPQKSELPFVATFRGTPITIMSETALEATIGGKTIALTINSKSELIGTIGASTFTFKPNSASALVATFEGTAITANSEPVLVGIMGSNTITFTTNSNSALVGTVDGSTITAKPDSTSRPGTQTHSQEIGDAYTGTGSKLLSSHGALRRMSWVLVSSLLYYYIIS